MSFGASLHCMDGRIQEPVNKYLKDKFDVNHVDTITEPGPIKILFEDENKPVIDSIYKRLSISIDVHGSKLIAISAHHDCAGNPAPKEVKVKQIKKCEAILKEKYPDIKIIKLWVNDDWQVEEL